MGSNHSASWPAQVDQNPDTESDKNRGSFRLLISWLRLAILRETKKIHPLIIMRPRHEIDHLHNCELYIHVKTKRIRVYAFHNRAMQLRTCSAVHACYSPNCTLRVVLFRCCPSKKKCDFYLSKLMGRLAATKQTRLLLWPILKVSKLVREALFCLIPVNSWS